MGKQKWTFDMIQAIALECTCSKELRNKDPRAYDAALKHKWLKEFTWFVHAKGFHKPWTKDEVRQEAMQYSSQTEFRKNSKTVFLVAKRNGWLEEFDWLEKTVKLTREDCYLEAQKYKTRMELHDNNLRVYSKAWENGWLDDYTWFVKPEKVRKWTEDACRQEAMKYSKLADYRHNSSSSYAAALANGWVKDYTWLERYGTQWTPEMTREIALQYDSRVSFERGNSAAYQAAKKNGWIDGYTWFKRPEVHNKKYHMEYVFEIARQFEYKRDFKEQFPGAYDAAVRNKWLKDMNWFKPNQKREFDTDVKKYVVYVYKDDNLNVVYVGLTNNIKQRHTAHKTVIRQSETVGMFFREKGIPLPEPIILKNGLDVIEAQFYEGYFVDKYTENGWIILNKMDTGIGKSSVGGGYVHYPKDKVIEVSHKFKTTSEFRKNEPGYYRSAVKNGWLCECVWLKKNRTNQKYSNEEIIEISKKYEYVKDFRENDYKIYVAAKYRGMLEEMYWLKRKGVQQKPRKWRPDNIIEKSREYSTLKDFREKEPGAYEAAIKRKILDKLVWLKKN